MRIGVIALTDEYSGRFCPLELRLEPDVLTSWNDIEVLLSAQERGEVFVQPPTTIGTCIYDERLFVGMLTQRLFVYRAITWIIHAANVDVTHFPFRKTVDFGSPSFYPSPV